MEKAVLGVIGKCFEDPELRAVGEGLGKTVTFNYNDPDVVIWIKSDMLSTPALKEKAGRYLPAPVQLN